MNNLKAFSLAVLVSVGVAGMQGITAQSTSESEQGSSMQMGDMMKQCRTQCPQTTGSIDKTMKVMEDAKQSNDPAKMRAAIEAGEKNLSKRKNHMNTCMSMMDMMQNMKGNHMGGMMAGHDQTQPDGKPK